jgi:protein phosphatase 1L
MSNNGNFNSMKIKKGNPLTGCQITRDNQNNSNLNNIKPVSNLNSNKSVASKVNNKSSKLLGEVLTNLNFKKISSAIYKDKMKTNHTHNNANNNSNIGSKIKTPIINNKMNNLFFDDMKNKSRKNNFQLYANPLGERSNSTQPKSPHFNQPKKQKSSNNVIIDLSSPINNKSKHNTNNIYHIAHQQNEKKVQTPKYSSNKGNVPVNKNQLKSIVNKIYSSERTLINIPQQMVKRNSLTAIGANRNRLSTNPNERSVKTSKNPLKSHNKDDSLESTEKEIFNPSANCCSEFSYKCDMNSNFRQSMEDFGKCFDKFDKDPSKGLFTLFDGHGGIAAVEYVKERFPVVFSKFLHETHENVEKSLIFTFQKLDDELSVLRDPENVGTTACIVYIKGEELFCANVGDTRCVLIKSDSSCKEMSFDHKCSVQTEVERIKSHGGVIFSGRVFGQLAITRALGDHALKKYGVVPTPHIHKHFINKNIDKYLIMASDGVTDVINGEEMTAITENSFNTKEIADKLIKNALDNGSCDNISCIVIKL